MSFKCDDCGLAQPAGTKPFIVTEMRPAEHIKPAAKEGDVVFIGEDGKLKFVSLGQEIDVEFKLGPCCSGQKVRVESKPDYKTFLHMAQQLSARSYMAKGRSVQSHIVKCKEIVTECSPCKAVMASYKSFPAPALSEALQQPKPPSFKTKMASVLMDHALERSIQGGAGDADAKAAIHWLSAYAKRGGGL
jgi:hypothetical protein